MYFSNVEYLKKCGTYDKMLEEMGKEIEYFKKHYKDDSRFLSGWGHNYFCSEDGGKLIYNIETPQSHECSICGKVYRGFEFDSVYITFLRNESIVNMIKSAILFKTNGEQKYLDFIINITNFYAENYDRFAIHSKATISTDVTHDVGGAGKIMPQGLNEAIVAIRIINALEIVKESLDKNWLKEVKEKLFDKIFELLAPQKMHIHNIPCWINSAIGVMGFFFDDKKWIDEASKNAFNINEQIAKGVTENGFWYEGSIHYNFFALEGMMNYLVFAKTYDFKVDKNSEETILKMLDAAYRYSFDNDIFPNPSDGWPNIGLKTYSYVYYMAYKVFGEKVLKYIKHIENGKNERPKLPLSEPYYFENKIPLERLLFLPELLDVTSEKAYNRKSESFKAYNCCLLKDGDINVFMKYGHQTKSHAHPDKMNIEIMIGDNILVKDLSNSGYGSKLCNKWHRKNASHNTCVVNFKESDIESGGNLIEFTEKSVKASTKAYEGVTYTRGIKIEDGVIYDEFLVDCNEESTIDFFLHLESEIETSSLSLEKTNEINQYEYIMEQKKVLDSGVVTIKNDVASLKINVENGVEMFIAKTYNNPANTLRDTIILRKKANNAKFLMEVVPNK